MSKDLVIPLDTLDKTKVNLVGGKAANLGELIRGGFPVPKGFAITSAAFKKFLKKNHLEDPIRKITEELSGDASSPSDFEEASQRLRRIIEEAPMPGDLEEDIAQAYLAIGDSRQQSTAYVAIRSSATAEDTEDASFAGQQETYLNVSGVEDVLVKVKKTWSSVFTPRSLFYRNQKGLPLTEISTSTVVQQMIDAKAAGVMFSIDPITGDPAKIVIEGNWGLGESVAAGSVTPDGFVVEKGTLQIVDRRISMKRAMYVRDSRTGRSVLMEVPSDLSEKPCLTDEEVKKLAELAVTIEEHYKRPMDIEWAIDKHRRFPDGVYVVQARPETVWSRKKPELVPRGPENPIVKGIPASPGIHAGRAKVVLTPGEARETIQQEDILVTRATNPDWVPYMRIAGAIITDQGGRTAHAAIVSRELGIPCIVGTENATSVMKTGEVYTVDAKAGVVYEGTREDIVRVIQPAPSRVIYRAAEAPITGTKVYMNLGVPDKIDEYVELPFDGIGLMRIEFIMASYIGDHPRHLIDAGREEHFIMKMAEGIARVARVIHPRPIIVRFSDFKTNEYAQLRGGERYEPKEENPMLGWRGVSRYISSQYEAAFRLECRAVRKCRDEWGLKNVWVMLPFVRASWEVEQCLKILNDEGLKRNADFKVWIMAEVPSIIFLADEFAKYCDGFSIGSNDLTQLILGVDRDSEILPAIDSRYFDERDPAVKRAITHLIETAHKNGTSVSICGQAPSQYPDFTEFLVRNGIDSVSVNPDAVISTRWLVASIEKKLILEKALGWKG